MQLVHWWALQYQPCENGPLNKLRRYSADWKALGSRAEFSMARDCSGRMCLAVNEGKRATGQRGERHTQFSSADSVPCSLTVSLGAGEPLTNTYHLYDMDIRGRNMVAYIHGGTGRTATTQIR